MHYGTLISIIFLDRARAINNTRMPNGPVVCATNLILGQQADKKSTGEHEKIYFIEYIYTI